MILIFHTQYLSCDVWSMNGNCEMLWTNGITWMRSAQKNTLSNTAGEG